MGRESRQVRNAVRVEAEMPAKLLYEDGSVVLGVSHDISMGGVSIETRSPQGSAPSPASSCPAASGASASR
uniref:PilZ domain-containing protein n=1 Tax=Phenylobacterium glaciei TaxID=2803784 RepID=A0A974P628_9CAUL|nr:PilZ domain-containing protein [Phenylobacterium glaciei]